MTRLASLATRMMHRYDIANEADRTISVQATTVLMHRLLEVIQPDITMEVGAYEASFSRRCAELLPDATIIALEANPYVWLHFAEEISQANPRIRYFQLAAWYRDRQPLQMRIRQREGEIAFDRVRGDHSLLWREGPDVEYEIREVESIRLDTLLDSHHLGDPAPRVALWVDVEGATGQVLRGAKATLGHTYVAVIEMESHSYWRGQSLEEEIDRLLLNLGLVPVFMDVADPSQRNVLYVRDALLDQPAIRHLIAEATART